MTTNFSVSLCTPVSYLSFSHLTAVSGFKDAIQRKHRVGKDQTRSKNGKGQKVDAIPIAEGVQDQGNQSRNTQNESYRRKSNIGDLGRFIIALFHDS